ncbi:MAG: 4a-hydroxytetrahydrobiopterin dehydratase [Patescibacteria group bacterium]
MTKPTLHLTEKRCVACEGDVPPLTDAEVARYIEETPGWHADGNVSISRSFAFKDFKEALAFLNRVGAIAEQEGHHPDLNLFNYKNILVTLTTHAIKGLSENDFIVAAKIDRL